MGILGYFAYFEGTLHGPLSALFDMIDNIIAKFQDICITLFHTSTIIFQRKKRMFLLASAFCAKLSVFGQLPENFMIILSKSVSILKLHVFTKATFDLTRPK